MDLHWFEQIEADVPAGDGWLSPGEAQRLADLRFPKRRADWRLGRWTAKRAVAACLDEPHGLADIEIRASLSGAPEVFSGGLPADFTISLSHRGGVACCAVTKGAVSLGCDLELVEPRSESFISDYFTAEEHALIAQATPSDRSRLVTLLWSAKESALKALRIGLRADTRSVTVKNPGTACVSSDSDCWNSLTVWHTAGEFHGWWRQSGIWVRTVVAKPRPSQHP
jgi:4'-phosphopantetheinyl transferase